MRKILYGSRAKKVLGDQVNIGCLPPQKKKNTDKMYVILVGTSVKVTEISNVDWQEYETEEEYGFDSPERQDKETMTFRMLGTWMRCNREQVRGWHRR